MPEKERTPPRQENEMGDVFQFKGHLQDQSADELLTELEIKLDTMTDRSYDGDVVDAYLAALENKAPVEQFDLEKGWNAFRAQHAILFEEEDTSNIEARPQSSRFRRMVPRLVAAAVVAVILGMFCAQAVGFDVFGAIGQWTEETFHFATPAVPSASTSPIATSGDLLYELEQYSTLQDAFDAYSISEPLAPSWVPDGYTLDYVEVNPSAAEMTFSASYSNGQNTLSFMYSYRIDGTFSSSTFEKDGSPVTEYIQNGIIHYIMSNLNVQVVAWVNGTCECSMWGNISIDEAKKVIDSIYENQEGTI